MRTTKKIIIRIIVAVAVAFILSKLKLLNIIEVSAKEVETRTPSDMYLYDNYNISKGYTSLNTYSVFNKDFYGQVSGKSSGWYSSVSWLTTFQNVNKQGTLVASFVTNARIRGEGFAVRAFAISNTGNSIVCNVESSSTDVSTSGAVTPSGNQSSYLSTITCNNTGLGTNGAVRIFVQSSFEVNSNTFFALSLVSFYIDDETQAILNDIKNSSKETEKSTKEIEKNTKETNDYLKSDDHSEADSEGASFFNDFGGNNHGISGIVTAPLRLLNSLTTASCTPLTFPLPFINEQITLPCMRGIYEQYFGVFFSLWQLITTGLISYNVSLNIYSKVRAMQNPNNDRIEVLNL